jgi:hypothetical protein
MQPRVAILQSMDYGFAGVHKRLLKPLVYLLVAAQLLLAVPAMASAQSVTAESASIPCDEMPGMGEGDECPCCPDGVDSMKDCLVSCMLAAVAAPSTGVSTHVTAPNVRVDSTIFAPLVSPSDPPLKPPPIR